MRDAHAVLLRCGAAAADDDDSSDADAGELMARLLRSTVRGAPPYGGADVVAVCVLGLSQRSSSQTRVAIRVARCGGLAAMLALRAFTR